MCHYIVSSNSEESLFCTVPASTNRVEYTNMHVSVIRPLTQDSNLQCTA